MNTLPRAGYYEAVIQLRPKSQKVLRFIRDQVRKRPGVFISKEVVLKTGIDIYLSSQRFARDLGRKLKNQFQGELTISRALYGVNRQTSREVYRGTVLFRVKE